MASAIGASEGHDFSRDELDPSLGEGLDEGAPRPTTDDGDDTLDGASLHARDDLFGLMERLTRARRFDVAPKLQRVWGDDLFVAHLMQLVDGSEWLTAQVVARGPDGAERQRACCDRFYFRDLDAARARLRAWWKRGPLYVEHPRRLALVRSTREDVAELRVSDEEASRVTAAITSYRAKRIDFNACLSVVEPYTSRAQALPAQLAGRWLAALVDPARLAPEGSGALTANDDLDAAVWAVESRWSTFLAPLVQRVWGDDRFVAAVAKRQYGAHWLSFAAPMRFEAPDAAEAAITAWWRNSRARDRAAMAPVLPVDALLDDVYAQYRGSIGAGSTLANPELLYLRDDPEVIRATLKKLADDHAPSTAAEVPYFVHRFGLDVDGLFELVVNRCDATSWYALVEVLPAALRVRSPRVVRHLAPLLRRKGLRPLIEAYLMGEGAGAIEGLLDMLAMKGSARTFATEWLARIAADEGRRATLAALVATRDAKTKKAVEPLLR